MINPMTGMLKSLGGFAVMSVKGILMHAARDVDCLELVAKAMYTSECAAPPWPPTDKALWNTRASAAILGLRDYFVKITGGGTP